MSDYAIRVEDLGKRYQVRHQRDNQRYVALRDVIAARIKRSARMLTNGLRSDSTEVATSGTTEDFWALRDVSFDVNRGDVVGIIGRNGAGKSTLLKIVSRITEPTEGRVRVRGRLASLLEVGTGFHPELTGRENVFLNGAILGMSHAEIRARFDEIVAFAELDRFIDTPVKHYSSGMYMRLAFAVAAHLEPEILIVDEVLAVGDAEFQRKCLGKMEDVSRSGRTVLFVSHNMAAVRQLCSSAVYLKSGQVVCSGPATAVIEEYLTAGDQLPAQVRGVGISLVDIGIVRPDAPGTRTSLLFGRSYVLEFTIEGNSSGTALAPVVTIRDSRGTLVTSICGPEEGVDFMVVDRRVTFSVEFDRLSLFPGGYQVSLHMYGQDPQPFLEAIDVLRFTVEASMLPGAGRAYRSDHGVVRVCSRLTARRESRAAARATAIAV
jgi:lipopolysaccharide transport system ATP-binding protein